MLQPVVLFDALFLTLSAVESPLPPPPPPPDTYTHTHTHTHTCMHEHTALPEFATVLPQEIWRLLIEAQSSPGGVPQVCCPGPCPCLHPSPNQSALSPSHRCANKAA